MPLSCLFAAPRLSLTLTCAAALAACGGGGGGASGTSTSADSATTYASDATLIASDATTALDAAVVAAQAVVGAQATASASTVNAASVPMSGAARVQPSAVVNVPVTCAGGGSASLSLAGGTVTSVLNGQLDAGEVYQVVFSNCRGAAGAAALNGTLAMTVMATTASTQTLALTATDLSVTLPRGTVTLAGSVTEQVGATPGPGGTVALSTHASTPSLTLVTQFNARRSTFVLSELDITRQSGWLDGVVQSSSIGGTHTLTATLPNGSFSYTVATQGGVTYAATGVPTAGAWSITLPLAAVVVSVGGAIRHHHGGRRQERLDRPDVHRVAAVAGVRRRLASGADERTGGACRGRVPCGRCRAELTVARVVWRWTR